MADWIVTTNPPGIWAWSAERREWKWYPPVDDSVLDEFNASFGKTF